MRVCVGVLSYNSEKTVIETLNSISSQTYGAGAIELIISDDCSTDNTLSITREWVKKNKHNFLSATILENKNNSGVSNSINKLFFSTKLKWIKPIAADDILAPDCIVSNIDFLTRHSSAKLIFSKSMQFFDVPDKAAKPTVSVDMDFFQSHSRQQYKCLLYENKVIAPTSFINVPFIRSIGGANENYAMLEDHPLWLNATYHNEKLYAFDKITVFHRLGDSLSQTDSNFGNVLFLSSQFKFHKEIIWPEVSLLKQIDDRVMFLSKKIIMKIFNNKRNKAAIFIYYCTFILRPLSIYKKIQGMMNDN